MFQSINPFDQSLLASYEAHTETQIEQKIAKAQLAYSSWRKTPLPARAQLFEQLAGKLREQQASLARLVSLEMGKIITEARAEVEKCAGACLYYAQNAETFLADEIVPTQAHKSFVRFEPLGVILGIMPWNFPLWQVMRFALPTLLSGNVVLLKHAPNVFGCALALEQIFIESGFPEGVFQSLLIDTDLTAKVVAHPTVRGVSFTGSEQTGKCVGKSAGEHLKKIVLELGGSDAFLVLPDADLARAVDCAVQSRMLNAGQSCIAAKRFLVHSSVYEAFLEQARQKIEILQRGNPLEESTQIGVIARADLAENADRQVQTSLQEGATLRTGGRQEGNFYFPTLLADVTPTMTVFREEVFAPVMCVSKVESEADMITIANQSAYGLGATIWSRDTEKAQKLACEIESGSVFINSLMRSDVRLPFGGIKNSGYGRELSYFGMREFVNVKTVLVEG